MSAASCTRDLVYDLIIDGDGPGSDVLESCDHAQGGGFAAARRPDQHHELTVTDFEVDSFHRRERRILFVRWRVGFDEIF